MTTETPTPRKRRPTPLGRLITRRLADLGITQGDLAKRLHVSHTYVSHIIAGTKMPSIRARDFIPRWSGALEITPEELIAEADLARYNVVPPGPADLTAEDRAILASVSHLPQDARRRVASALRTLFPAPTPGITGEEVVDLSQAMRGAEGDLRQAAAQVARRLERQLSDASAPDAPDDKDSRHPHSPAPSPANDPEGPRCPNTTQSSS